MARRRAEELLESERTAQAALAVIQTRLQQAQVVTNLVSNAMTYGMAEKPIRITSVVSHDELMVEVHNFGRPVPAALLPHLFEPLRRGESQVKLSSRSVGLGLYIVQQIALAHGGKVDVVSTADEGTTFRVRAPSGLVESPQKT